MQPRAKRGGGARRRRPRKLKPKPHATNRKGCSVQSPEGSGRVNENGALRGEGGRGRELRLCGLCA